MKYFVALGAALVLNATANLLMKFGMRSIADSGGLMRGGLVQALLTILASPVLVLGVICFALNLIAYMYALQRLPIGVAYPIMVTLGFAIIVIVAGFYLHEHLSWTQWVGVVLILAGVWLVASRATLDAAK